MINQKYSEAIAEILDILKHTKQEDVKKISPEFMEYLNNNTSKTYISNLDHTCSISQMQLKKETRIILAIIYRKFWCREEDKKTFDKMLIENEDKYQQEIREKYRTDDIFKKRERKNKSESNESLEITVYKENFIKRIVNKIKNIFK